MTVLLIGNSLTAGNLGIPWSRYLKFPGGNSSDIRIKNWGLDGDTLHGVRNRLEQFLSMGIPDILVIQTGANDILLPEMASRGKDWSLFVDEMIKRGSVPVSGPEEFNSAYNEMIGFASSRGMDNRNIICVTIPPIGENLESGRNMKRLEYNRELRRAVEDAGAVLADVATAFEEELRKIGLFSDWFFSGPGGFAADVKEVRRGKGAMGLSEERGLYLTMDGAHLNERGAELMGNVISSAIAVTARRTLRSTVLHPHRKDNSGRWTLPDKNGCPQP